MKTNTVLTLFAVFQIFIVLTSCVNPLDVDTILNVTDEVAPTISIMSPADGSTYSQVVYIEGTVEDSAESQGDNRGSVTSVSCEILSTSVSPTVNLGTDGHFDCLFETASLSGNLTVRITAMDWNGNTAESSLVLVAGTSDIPSFSATGSSSRVTVDWDPIPLAESYTLYYTTNNSYPNGWEGTNGNTMEGVSYGDVITGLLNGHMHVFRLRANLPDPLPDSWSDYVKAVPLSSHTLAPTVSKGLYDEIHVQWPAIPAGIECELWRSHTAPDSGFYNLTGALDYTSYTDTNVVAGQDYYYAIQPVEHSTVLSESVWGRTSTMKFDEIVGEGDTYYARGVDAVTNRVYVADLYDFYIFDTSSPAAPVLISQTAIEEAQDVFVEGNYAYIANGSYGLQILDISDENNPQMRGSYDTLNAQEVVVSGNYAFIADLSYLVVLDISNKDAPTLAAQRSAGAYGVEVVGSTVYVAGSGLDTFSFSAPSTLTPLDQDQTVSSRGIAVSGTHAFVAARDQGLWIYDVSNPSSIALEKTVDTPANAEAVEIVDDTAVVADYFSGIQLIDISSIADAEVVEAFDTPGNQCQDLVCIGDIAYLADGWGGIRVLNHTERFLDATMDDDYPFGDIRSVTIYGSNAYVAGGSAGLIVLDVSDPGNILYRGGYNPGSVTLDIAVAGTLAVQSAYYAGARVLDVSDPTAPSSLGFIGGSYGSQGVDLIGDLAYICEGTAGLHIYDLSEPSSPVERSTYDTPDKALEVVVQDSMAYVADNTTGLVILDVADPDSPELVGICNTGGTAKDIVVSGDYVFIADYSDGVKIIDVSTPSSPEVIASYDTIGYANGVESAGDYLFVGHGVGGVLIIDVSDPSEPRLKGQYDTAPVNAGPVAARDDYVYAVMYNTSLESLQIAPTDQP